MTKVLRILLPSNQIETDVGPPNAPGSATIPDGAIDGNALRPTLIVLHALRRALDLAQIEIANLPDSFEGIALGEYRATLSWGLFATRVIAIRLANIDGGSSGRNSVEG